MTLFGKLTHTDLPLVKYPYSKIDLTCKLGTRMKYAGQLTLKFETWHFFLSISRLFKMSSKKKNVTLKTFFYACGIKNGDVGDYDAAALRC